MNRIAKILSALVLFALAFSWPSWGQGGDVVSWFPTYKQLNDSTVELTFTAHIDGDWHLYSTNLPKGGPNPTVISYNSSDRYTPHAEIREVGDAHKAMDEVFHVELTMYSDSVQFIQLVDLHDANPVEISGTIDFQICQEGMCNVGDWEFSIPIGEVEAASEAKPSATVTPAAPASTTVSAASETPAQKEETSSNLVFFFICFFAGLAGLLTPCVFPMIPMTVSFFLGKENRTNALLNALVFGLSIVALYTLLGLAVSLTSMGADFITDLTTHWLTNLIFFLLFIVFAAAFFGMFEIRLPSSFANKTDAKAGKGGFVGSFFFALTTVIVSLSCVGPIVGALLVQSAAGPSIRPVMGMFAFALGFSIPFTLFAIFPSWLNKLPKSGGWMNSVKIVLGFIVLAFSMKFLLGIDVGLGLNILTRPIFLVVWIGLAIFLSIYLLGYLRFKMDSPLQHVGFLRMLLALASFCFAIYLIPGLFGAPLYSMSGFMPAPSSEDFSLQSSGMPAPTSQANLCDAPKYADFIHLPKGLDGYRDYKQAVACAKEQNKPVFIEFSGHGCANCKEMAAKVLSQPQVASYIMENFIFTALYVDDRYELPKGEWYVSPVDGKEKKTLGKQNLDLEMGKFQANGQPLFFVITPEEEIIAGPRGRDTDVSAFLTFLEDAKKQFDQR